MKTRKGRPKSACELCHGKGVVTEKHVHGPYCYVETTGEDKLVCNRGEDTHPCPGCAAVKRFEEMLEKLGISTLWRDGFYEDVTARVAWALVSDSALTKGKIKLYWEYRSKDGVKELKSQMSYAEQKNCRTCQFFSGVDMSGRTDSLPAHCRLMAPLLIPVSDAGACKFHKPKAG